MPEPITLAILSGIGSSLGGIVTASKVIYELKNTPQDVKACLKLVERVYDDIQYVVHLRTKHLKILSKSYRIELGRLDGIIADAERSILDVGRLLEPCRREAHGGRVPLISRMEWVLGGSSALVLRTPNLQQQHVAIVAEIQWIRYIESMKPLQDFVESNTTYDNLELLKTKRRSSSKSSSIAEGARVAPPAYTPHASTFQEEDAVGGSMSENLESRSDVLYHSPSVIQGIWNSPQLSTTSPTWQAPAELPDSPNVAAHISPHDSSQYVPFSSVYANGHAGSQSSLQHASSTPARTNTSTSSLESTPNYTYLASQALPSTATQNHWSGNPVSHPPPAQRDFTRPQTSGQSGDFINAGGNQNWQWPSQILQHSPARITPSETLEAEEEEDTQATYFREIARQQAERRQRAQERNRLRS